MSSTITAVDRQVVGDNPQEICNKLADVSAAAIVDINALQTSVTAQASDGTYTCLVGDAVGDWVYISAASTVASADADGSGTFPSVGVITSKPTTTSAVVRHMGEYTTSGLTAGAIYYLSATAKQITATPPTAPAAMPVGIAKSTTVLLIIPNLVSAVLRSTTANLGASTVGITDAGSFTTAAQVEAALQEIYQHILTAQAPINIPLGSWREVDANGDVANSAGGAGILSSNTTPILRGDAAESWEISWAATNADPIQFQTSLPPDFDGTANATLDLWVYTDNAGGGGIDAASFTVETGWDGGALVSDTATDGTPATSWHKITATIAAADIPDAPSNLSIALTPAAHANDPTQLVGARLNYRRKLLTS